MGVGVSLVLLVIVALAIIFTHHGSSAAVTPPASTNTPASAVATNAATAELAEVASQSDSSGRRIKRNSPAWKGGGYVGLNNGRPCNYGGVKKGRKQ